LDSRTSFEVMELFAELNERDGITVILVTHDQDVGRDARRTLVLRDGRVVVDTTRFEEAVAALHPAEAEAVHRPHSDRWQQSQAGDECVE
ncbi:MAG TPA: hypothetical protein VJ809_13665, partial [Pirellulales bacterium]|nr:hypothetical protein [Pirellulales bacterium]